MRLSGEKSAQMRVETTHESPGMPGVMEPSWMFQSPLSWCKTAPYLRSVRGVKARHIETHFGLRRVMP